MSVNIEAVSQQRRVWRPQHIENIEIAYRKSYSLHLPSHLHEELEMTIMQDTAWEFYYRGTKYIVPPGGFTLTQPGEVHKAYNAGFGRGGTIAEVTEEDYEAVFSINVKGVLFALQQAAKKIQDNGRIINVSSTTTVYPSPGLAIYAASKNAIKMFTEILAQEIGDRGVTVNTILPGPTIPGMFDNMPQEVHEQAANSSPFNRIGRTEDIADVVAFLASDDARWITAQHIIANGGAKI